MYPHRGQVTSFGLEGTGVGVGVSPALSGGGGRACWAEPISPRSRSAAGTNAAAARARVLGGRCAGRVDSENDRPDLIKGYRGDGGRRVIDLECDRHPTSKIGVLQRRPQILETVDRDGLGARLVRSEEHTSELQSRLHLVCRLLLEKKK